MPIKSPEFPDYDPRVSAALLNAASELGGGLPSYLGIRTTEVGPGRMACELEARDELLNPFGTLHGGVISALTDHVLGSVLYTVVQRGAWAATTEFKLNLLRAVKGGTLRAEAVIISLTSRTAVVRVDVTNDGTAVGAAQGTVTIVIPKNV